MEQQQKRMPKCVDGGGHKVQSQGMHSCGKFIKLKILCETNSSRSI